MHESVIQCAILEQLLPVLVMMMGYDEQDPNAGYKTRRGTVWVELNSRYSKYLMQLLATRGIDCSILSGTKAAHAKFLCEPVPISTFPHFDGYALVSCTEYHAGS
jgi:hypothetical protein